MHFTRLGMFQKCCEWADWFATNVANVKLMLDIAEIDVLKNEFYHTDGNWKNSDPIILLTFKV